MPADDLGRVGIWTFALDQQPIAAARELAAELDELGYGAIWLPEAVGKDPLVHAAMLLEASPSIRVATGIASVYARDAMAMAAGHQTLTEAFGDRFVLGVGVSHQPMVEGLRGHHYDKPLAYMRSYLEAMDAALYLGAAPDRTPRRVIGALGPKMLALAATHADGAHPYNGTPEHTAAAREILGPDKMLAPELAVIVETDADLARAAGREHLATYLDLPNYTNNLRRHGFGDADFADGGSDRLIDAVVPWGDETAIAAAVAAHHDAGADHVCVQVVAPRSTVPLAEWRLLAAALC
ncbi:MAG: TIGR03620 family F420-dependent LLM class oxidoreductase [Acidimicrobiales bacterium]